MKQNIFLSIILSFLSCFANNEVLAFVESMNTSITPRIIGGATVGIHHYPFASSLRIGGLYFCVATIIGDVDLMAPAHCFTHTDQVMYPYLDVTVHTSTSSSRDVGTLYRIRQVTIHPGWTGIGNRNHNLAHIKVSLGRTQVSMQFNDYSRTISLPNQDVTSNTAAYVSSWGTIVPNGPPSEQLNMLKMWTLKYDQCQPFLSANIELQKEQLCAYQAVGFGCSQTDRGAPLASQSGVIGIHSWVAGPQCANGEPEIYTNIFYEKDFLVPLILDNQSNQ